jgi:pimeloyl-ACP methyl ester carboxylesterase/TM2 domain-containing membrane protein YozV
MTKRRNPAVAAVLSLVSTGLGQVYNGEISRGIILKIGLLLSFCTYAFLVFKSTRELLLWSSVLAFFIILKVYSIFQAWIRSRKLGSAYVVQKFNKSSIYVLLTIVFLAASMGLPLMVARFSLMEMTPYHPFRSEAAKQLYLDFYEEKAKEWPVESETEMVDTSYGQTFVRISGPADGSPLVLLPGASANSLMWLPNIEALSRSFRTYAVDNIYDFGRSVFTRTLRTPLDFVEWLDELFIALNLEDRFSLMGMSYGGWLTGQYALRHPERLNKIVLLAPASTVLPLSRCFLMHASVGLVPHRHFIRGMMNWLFSDWTNGGQGRLLLEDWTESIYLGSRCFKPKILVNPTVLTDIEWKNLGVEALYMVGENEKIYSAHEAVERLQKVAPQVKTQIVLHAGHDLTVVQADLINGIVIKFLEQD